jgi:hypothetical protein
VVVFLALADGAVAAGAGRVEARRERDAADRARERAVDVEANTKAFSDFLVTRILAATRPAEIQDGLGVDVRMSEALTATEGGLKEAFRGRPRRRPGTSSG